MADRSRRVRRQISHITDETSGDSASDSGEDYDPRVADSMRRAGRYDASTTSPGRPKRTSGGVSFNSRSGATIQRSSASAPDDRRQSLKLTVKAPPSKLREVMRANEVDSLHDVLGGGKVLDVPRSSRRVAPARTSDRPTVRPKYTEYGESDIEDGDDEEEEEDEDEEEEEEEEDEEQEQMNDFDELGAEAEGRTDDEEDDDVEMEDAPNPPKPPVITVKPPSKIAPKQSTKLKFLVKPPNVGLVKSVEDQEMDDDEDEDDSSDPSDLSDEGGDGTNLNEEDAEGEDEELEDDDAQGADVELGADEELDEEEEEDDSDSDRTPGSGSATPDLTKLTKRQRGQPEESGSLMALDMAPQQRKFFTDAEKAMKKDEHARKRKELTKRKVQEEKNAALNRLLKPQASKARGAAPKPETLAAATAAAAVGSSVDEDEMYYEKANPLYTRWVSTQDGVKLGVPEEWLDKRIGNLFGPPLPPSNGSLLQEI